jgi:hypothetical protein
MAKLYRVIFPVNDLHAASALYVPGTWSGRALLLLVAATACSSIVPPQTRVLAPIDPGTPRLVYVAMSAESEREPVVAALGRAGFSVTSDPREAPLVLSVKTGGTRASKRCGAIRNVVYDLRHGTVRIAVVKARGWTGSCSPSIYLDMANELARLFEH